MEESDRKLARVIRVISALLATVSASTLFIAYPEAPTLTVVGLVFGLIGSIALAVSMTMALRKTGASEEGAAGKAPHRSVSERYLTIDGRRAYELF